MTAFPPWEEKAKRLSACLALLGLLAAPLPAQDRGVGGGGTATGAVTGVVTDAKEDSAVAGAVILVRGTLLSVLTDARGAFRIAGLDPGTYTVRAVAIGYESVTLTGLVVGAGETHRVDFRLEKSVVELPGIVVTASRSEERPGESPVSTALITRQDLVRRNVVTLDEALPYEPGVALNHGDLDIRGSTGIAGGAGSRVLVLVDGHPILTGDTGEMDWNILPVLNIDRVEIVRGPASALYGSGALGGVVNVITTPLPAEARTTLRGWVGAYDLPVDRFASGLQNFQGVDLEHSQPLGELGTDVFVERATSDGFTQSGSVSRWLARAKFVWPQDSPLPWEGYALWGHEDDGNFFIWKSDSQPYEVPATDLGDWVRTTWVNLGATVVPYGSPSLLLHVSPYLYHDAVQNFYQDTVNYHRATRVGANVLASISPGEAHTATVGAEVARTGVVSDILGARTLWDLSLYGQDEAPVVERLKATLGARVDYHTVAGGEGQLVVSPKLGFVVHATRDVDARLSLSHGYRAPSPVEQFVSTTQSGFRVVPNPALKGERAWAGEVGATATIAGRLWLDGALFQSEYYDFIGPAPVPGQFGEFQFQNVTRARVRGVDIEAKVGLLANRLGLHATYTFLDTKDLGTGEPLPYRSAHNLAATLSGGAFRFEWGVDYRFRSAVERVLAYPLDPRGSCGPIPSPPSSSCAINLVDLRMGRRVLGWDVEAKVANLFQEQYVDIQERTPGVPRRLLVSAERSF